MRNVTVTYVSTTTATRLAVLLIGFGTAPHPARAETPMEPSFVYQGLLKFGGEPIDGEASFQFLLYDAEVQGNFRGSLGRVGVPVVNGLFEIQLDFGTEVFNGDARWLEIIVESPPGAGNATTLVPRQPISVTPYALHTRGLYVDELERVGVGTEDPLSSLHVGDVGRYYWGLGDGWGDFTLNNGAVGFSIGVATSGSGTGDVYMWPKGGTERLMFGNPTNGRIMTIGNGGVGIGTTTPLSPLHVDVETAEGAFNVTQTGTGRGATFNVNNGGNDDPAVYVSHNGVGPSGQFFINNVGNSAAAVDATSTGSGPGVHGKGASGGAGVKGSALGSGRAASFHTEGSLNESPTVYAEQKGRGRCGHFRITNANNDLTAVSASTTGDGLAVSGYTIGAGSAGKFEINNASSDSPALQAKTNGSGYAISAEATTDVTLSGGGTVVIGSPDRINVALDANEIMARDNGATSPLYLNRDGGDVFVGGHVETGGDVLVGGAIDIGYEIVNVFSSGDAADALCPVGKKAIGGGCSCGTDDVEGSYPFDEGTGWRCLCSGDLTSALAICARVK